MEEEQNKQVLQPVEARLKWFNIPNGFGFLIPEDDQETDAFVHITTLQNAGIKALGEGARVLCRIDHSPKGAIVTEIVELLDQGVMPSVIPDKNNRNHEDVQELTGAVKWYCPEKGFGFVLPDDGKKDVFVHQSCLKRLGLDPLEAGRRVVMTVKSVCKGREALDIKVVDGQAEES